MQLALYPGKEEILKKQKKINFELNKLLRGKNGSKIKSRYIAPNIKKWTIKEGKEVIPNPALFVNDGIHLNNDGYDKLVSYIQEISLKTSLPLIPPNDRDGGLEDPYKHLAIGLPEKITHGDEPPPLWNPRFAAVNGPSKII